MLMANSIIILIQTQFYIDKALDWSSVGPKWAALVDAWLFLYKIYFHEPTVSAWFSVYYTYWSTMWQNKVCIKHLQNVTSWRFTYLHRKPYSLLKMIEQLSSFLQLRTKKLFYPYPKMQKSRRLNYGIKKKNISIPLIPLILV